MAGAGWPSLSSSLSSGPSVDRELEPDLCVALAAARFEMLGQPEVRRLGENLRRKSSMVFTGDFSSNLTLTFCRG